MGGHGSCLPEGKIGKQGCLHTILSLRIDLFTPPVPSFTSGHLIMGRTDA